MAQITKNGSPSISSTLPPQNQTIVGYCVGEDIGAGDACYIDPTTRLILRCDGSANDGIKNRVLGFAAKDALAAQVEPLTLYTQCTWGYGKNLTPGPVFLSGSVNGGLADAASAGGLAPCGYIVDSKQIHLFMTRY